MQRKTRPAGGGRMAAWLATGGALPPAETTRETTADDGLEAARPSATPFGCWGEPALKASGMTLFVPCGADDGLEAYAPTHAPMGCRADDGLEAAYTRGPVNTCAGDDGLKAARPSSSCWGEPALMAGGRCRADDGLRPH